jgi:DNA-binding MarR family transcriptional regulator
LASRPAAGAPRSASSERAEAGWEDFLVCYRSLRRELATVVERHGMMLSEFRALQYLAEGSAPLGQLAAHLGLTPATLTTLARGLRARGWARSTTDPRDRRRELLSATAQGRAVCRRARADYLVRLGEIAERIPGPEREALLQGLGALRTVLASAPATPAGGGSPTRGR